MTGTSPVASVKMATFDERGEGGLSVPAANTPEEASGANARVEMMPTRTVG